MKKEIWKSVYVDGIKTIYESSNLGNMRSFFRGKWHTRKSYKCKATGYRRVGLKINGKTETKLVHRLVAINFIDNPHSYKYVNHIDGNKENNVLTNLEWCTFQMNEQHAWQIGLKKKKYGADAPRARLIGRYFAGILIRSYNALIEAEKEGFKSDCICSAAKRNGTHKGFNWQYLD